MKRPAIRRAYTRKKRSLNDEKTPSNAYDRWERLQLINVIDERMGFDRLETGPPLEGWLINMHEVKIINYVLCLTVDIKTSLPDDSQGGKSAMAFYFIQEDGNTFKTVMSFEPYFFVACKVNEC